MSSLAEQLAKERNISPTFFTSVGDKPMEVENPIFHKFLGAVAAALEEAAQLAEREKQFALAEKIRGL